MRAPLDGFSGLHSGRVVKVGEGKAKVNFDDFDSEDVEISFIKPWSKTEVEVCFV